MNIKNILSKIYRSFYPLSPTEIYKRMGVTIGENCKIQNEVMIDYSHYWHIFIGNNVTIAPRVHILAHDASTKLHLEYSRIGKVIIEDNVFIGAGSIILPGVIIGKNSIIGAGSVVTKNIPPNVVSAGNPTRTICSLETYLENQKKTMSNSEKFDESYTLKNKISKKKMEEMNNKIGENDGFVY